MAHIFRFFTYRLNNPAGPVSLDLNVGNGQAASTYLQLDGKRIAPDKEDSFSCDIPNPGSLAGKELDIITTVKDVNEDSDDISLRIKLSGGASVSHPPADRLRAAPNGYVHFTYKVIFL
jgi:hypothetical protein